MTLTPDELKIISLVVSPAYMQGVSNARADANCGKQEHWVENRRVKGGGYCRISPKAKQEEINTSRNKKTAEGLGAIGATLAAGAVLGSAVTSLSKSNKKHSKEASQAIVNTGEKIKNTNSQLEKDQSESAIGIAKKELSEARKEISSLEESISNQIKKTVALETQVRQQSTLIKKQQSEKKEIKESSQKEIEKAKNELQNVELQRESAELQLEQSLKQLESDQKELNTVKRNLGDLEKSRNEISQYVGQLEDTLLISPVKSVSGKGRPRKGVDPEKYRKEPRAPRNVKENIERSISNAQDHLKRMRDESRRKDSIVSFVQKRVNDSKCGGNEHWVGDKRVQGGGYCRKGGTSESNQLPTQNRKKRKTKTSTKVAIAAIAGGAVLTIAANQKTTRAIDKKSKKTSKEIEKIQKLAEKINSKNANKNIGLLQDKVKQTEQDISSIEKDISEREKKTEYIKEQIKQHSEAVEFAKLGSDDIIQSLVESGAVSADDPRQLEKLKSKLEWQIGVSEGYVKALSNGLDVNQRELAEAKNNLKKTKDAHNEASKRVAELSNEFLAKKSKRKDSITTLRRGASSNNRCGGNEHWVNNRRVQGGGYCRTSPKSQSNNSRQLTEEQISSVTKIGSGLAVGAIAGATAIALTKNDKTRTKTNSEALAIERQIQEIEKTGQQVEFSSSETENNAQEITSLRKQLEDEQANINTLQSNLTERTEETDQLRVEVERRSVMLERAEANSSQIIQRLETEAQRIQTEASSQIESLQRNLQEEINVAAKLRGDLETLKLSSDENSPEAIKLQQKSAERQQKIRELEQQAKERQQEAESKVRELEQQVKEQVVKREEEFGRNRKEITRIKSGLEQEIESTRLELDRLSTQLGSSQKELGETQKNLNKLQQAHDKATQYITKLEDSLLVSPVNSPIGRRKREPRDPKEYRESENGERKVKEHIERSIKNAEARLRKLRGEPINPSRRQLFGSREEIKETLATRGAEEYGSKIEQYFIEEKFGKQAAILWDFAKKDKKGLDFFLRLAKELETELDNPDPVSRRTALLNWRDKVIKEIAKSKRLEDELKENGQNFNEFIEDLSKGTNRRTGKLVPRDRIPDDIKNWRNEWFEDYIDENNPTWLNKKIKLWAANKQTRLPRGYKLENDFWSRLRRAPAKEKTKTRALFNFLNFFFDK